METTITTIDQLPAGCSVHKTIIEYGHKDKPEIQYEVRSTDHPVRVCAETSEKAIQNFYNYIKKRGILSIIEANNNQYMK